MPKGFSLSGKYSKDFFNKNGQLLKIKNIEDYPLEEILIKEFKFSLKDAKEISEFLLPMLEYDPKKRISAKQCLQAPWLWT